MTAEPPTDAPAISKLAGSELSRLLLHSSHYLAGLVGCMLIGLVSFPIFTRVFSIAEYGLMDLAQRVVLALTIVSKAGLQNAVLRFYDGDRFAVEQRSARRYYSTMYLGAFATSIGVAMVFLAAVGLGPNTLISAPLAKLVYLIAALGLLRSLGATLWGFLRIEERTRVFNVAMVTTKAASVAVVCALLPFAGRTARTYFTGIILVEAVLAAALTLSLLRRKLLDPACFDVVLFRAGIVFGMPLVVYEFAFAVLGSADRFLVRYFLGPDALGFYSVAYGLAQHANDLLLAPLILALFPIYMRIWTSSGAEKTIEFLTVTLDLFLMTAAGVFAVTLASARPLVVLLASSKYAGADRLIPVLLAGLLIYATYVFVAAGLLIHKRTLEMAGLLVLSAVINIGLNCLLLPYMGLNGSALATLLSYALCILLLASASNRLLPLRIKLSFLARYATAAALAALAGSVVELGSPILDLLSRSVLTVSVYGAVLYGLDSRVRRAARWTLMECRTRLL